MNSDHAFDGTSRGDVAPEMDARMGDSGPWLRLVQDSLRPVWDRGAGLGAGELQAVVAVDVADDDRL